MLFLVRHAKAGNRTDWEGDDRLRPLVPAGRRQAEALATLLAPLATGRVVSSPYIRCIETVEPLAAAIGAEVEADDRLAEDTGFAGALELLATLPDGSVLCSHGDVIPDTVGALERRGCRFHSEPEWRKAGVWLLTRAADGTITDAHCWPPPDA